MFGVVYTSKSLTERVGGIIAFVESLAVPRKVSVL